MTIEFRYGALCDDLEVQANRQGFTFGDKKEFVDSLRFAYNVGKFHFLTDKEAESALKKVHKKVLGCLKPLEVSE